VKGGTGKTTIVYALAWIFSEEERRVLAIDLDPQGNLTFAFHPLEGLPTEAASSRLFQVRKPTPFPLRENLHILWADGHLYSYETRGSTSEMKAPAQSIASLKPFYDFIILDTPTSLRPLTKAALLACDYVVAVVEPSPFSVLGLIQLAQGISDLRDRFGYSPEMLGVVVNMVDRTRVSEQVLDTIRNLLGKEKLLGVIPKTVKVKQALLSREPIHRFASGTPLQQALISLAESIKKQEGGVLRWRRSGRSQIFSMKHNG